MATNQGSPLIMTVRTSRPSNAKGTMSALGERSENAIGVKPDHMLKFDTGHDALRKDIVRLGG